MMSQMEGGCPLDYNTITDLFLQVAFFLHTMLNMLLIFLFFAHLTMEFGLALCVSVDREI
jgi:hypothetical protein